MDAKSISTRNRTGDGPDKPLRRGCRFQVNSFENGIGHENRFHCLSSDRVSCPGLEEGAFGGAKLFSHIFFTARLF
jgi:hypothetical protein